MDELDNIILPKTHSSMYLMHKYWARKPANIVSEYIMKYTQPHEIVLDPFMGSGVTVIESLFLDRKSVGIDINPVSAFICKNTAEMSNIMLLEEGYNYLKSKINEEMSIYSKLNIVNCPKCAKRASLTHIIWDSKKPQQDQNYLDFQQEFDSSHYISEIRLRCQDCGNLYYTFDSTEHNLRNIAPFVKNILKLEKNALNYLARAEINPPSFQFKYKIKVYLP